MKSKFVFDFPPKMASVKEKAGWQVNRPVEGRSVRRNNRNSPLPLHKRRRHKAYRQSSQSSNISLYEELANSIEEDSPLPELCDINAR